MEFFEYFVTEHALAAYFLVVLFFLKVMINHLKKECTSFPLERWDVSKWCAVFIPSIVPILWFIPVIVLWYWVWEITTKERKLPKLPGGE